MREEHVYTSCFSGIRYFVLINPFHLNIQYQCDSLIILPPPSYDLAYKQVTCPGKKGVGPDPPIKVSKGQVPSGGMVEGWDPFSIYGYIEKQVDSEVCVGIVIYFSRIKIK
jgi:hypothetical protein